LLSISTGGVSEGEYMAHPFKTSNTVRIRNNFMKCG